MSDLRGFKGGKAGTALIALGLAILLLGLILAVAACGGTTATTTVPAVTTTAPAVTTTAPAPPPTTGGGAPPTAGASTGSTIPLSESKLIGKWTSEQLGRTLEFTADGKLIGTDTSGGGMTFTFADTGTSYIMDGQMEAAYTISGDTLTITQPEGDIPYTRVP